MIKVILHGGTASSREEPSSAFIKEILNREQAHLHICCIYFASKSDAWERYFEQDSLLFEKFSHELQKKLSFEISETDVHTLEEQLQRSDIIYIRGGQDTDILQKELSKLHNPKTIFANKTVVGSSAGAYVLSTYYLSRRFGIQEGLGIFPIKISAHYDESIKKELLALKNHKEVLPIYTLPEQEYVVLEF